MKRIILGESIFGMATVGRHEKPNFLIAVNPDANRAGICYFKYYDSNEYSSAEHVTRLNFRKPEKVKHQNHDGKTEWQLNAKDRKDLCNYLDELSDEIRYVAVTNWQVALYHWNHEYGLINESYPDEYKSRIEAFISGFYDTDENVHNPSYVASTLERPDYRKVEN